MKPPPIVQCSRAGTEGCSPACKHSIPHQKAVRVYGSCGEWGPCGCVHRSPVRCVRVKEGE